MPIDSETDIHAQKPRVLVVGGAGFIGSHMVLHLLKANFQPVVLDNLSKGHSEAVKSAELIVGDLNDYALLESLFKTYQFTAVFHFASFIEVGESVLQPDKYYNNNVVNTLNLLNAMKGHTKAFIFSSSAAVYGQPHFIPINEDHPIAPLNPYGKSKSMVESILEDYARAYGLSYATLRYFNAAGADPSGKLGERHEPESHLIPLIFETLTGKRKELTIYGQDYDTPDGTCIRDYIHVNDLCEAHLLALQELQRGGNRLIYNLGTGQGYSVKEIVEKVSALTGKPIPYHYGPRRPGDPAVLVADPRRAFQELKWLPQYPKIETLIQHAWNSYIKH